MSIIGIYYLFVLPKFLRAESIKIVEVEKSVNQWNKKETEIKVD